MFHLFITLTYIVPNIYLFFRIKSLFITKGYGLWYFIVYLFVAALYPISGIFSDEETGFVIQALSFVSGYTLPFFLYLFFSVILFDLFLLINLLIKVVPLATRKSFSFRLYTLSAMIAFSILVVIAGAINLNTIRVSEYKVTVPKKNSAIDHLRIVFVADLHTQQNTRQGFVDQFVRKAIALQPDLMLYGGDMVEGDGENETTEAIESSIRKIRAKYGSFGVNGNHEFYGGQQQGSFFRKAGITILCDTIIKIDSSFYLAGRYDEHFGQRKTVSQIIGGEPLDLPVILMDHRPSEMLKTSLANADVQFSGHTHNGQLFPGNFITRSIFELSWGYRKIRNTHFFVTSGLRLWGPPVRTTGKSEIMMVDVTFE